MPPDSTVEIKFNPEAKQLIKRLGELLEWQKSDSGLHGHVVMGRNITVIHRDDGTSQLTLIKGDQQITHHINDDERLHLIEVLTK